MTGQCFTKSALPSPPKPHPRNHNFDDILDGYEYLRSWHERAQNYGIVAIVEDTVYYDELRKEGFPNFQEVFDEIYGRNPK